MLINAICSQIVGARLFPVILAIDIRFDCVGANYKQSNSVNYNLPLLRQMTQIHESYKKIHTSSM